MTTPQLEEDGILREWAPLSRLLQQIPLKTRRGLFMEDVKLTCVDAVSECIAVGASPGIIYWYNRSSHAVVQLTPEKNAHSITCIKLVSTVDIMVAAGDDNGIVTIFKVPKPTPDWLPHYKKETIDKSIERYTIGGLHSGRITTLEWSLNGQKLFSGDSAGQVIYTEIDFYMNLSKAREILNENYSVVQLSYNQRTRALVVSTVLRCTICFNEQNSWRVVQVGQKERSSLLALGGVFYYTEGVPTIPLIYCCRPGLRLWQANTDGSVQQTILFKVTMYPITVNLVLYHKFFLLYIFCFE
ncbi:hypothetical protein AAG570_001080 [Ranatra chinensis]|uniref:Uncharacterized protein n=1 Tax=Ranatra chinensis TaxID=642074 RepID=A0ABD0YZ00_9HEMI